jgi:hypothetical protein
VQYAPLRHAGTVVDRLTRPKHDDAVGPAMDLLDKRIAVFTKKFIGWSTDQAVM